MSSDSARRVVCLCHWVVPISLQPILPQTSTESMPSSISGQGDCALQGITSKQSHPMLCRLKMKIEAIYRDEKEVTSTRSGENLRLRVTGGLPCFLQSLTLQLVV